MTQEITQNPWTTWQLISKLLMRKTVAVDQFQPLTIRLNNLHCSAEQRAEFRLMFNCQHLPPSFLFNLAYRHLGQLLAQAMFPSKLMGLIHLSSEYHLHEAIDWSTMFDLKLAMKTCNQSEKGLVYQINIELIQDDVVRLKCENTILDKDKNYQGKQVPKATDNFQLATLASNKLTAKLARSYAKLSGDYNPIHLFSISAKLLGMKRAVMHGMYNLHWSLTQLDNISSYRKISAQFNRPCYLPKHVALAKVEQNEYGLFSNNQKDRHLYIKIE